MTNTVSIHREPYEDAALAKIGVFGYFFVMTVIAFILLIFYVLIFKKKHGPEVTVVKMA